MKQIFLHINSLTDYELREAELEGVQHWVVPVVLMVEGVHSGSEGPLLYTAEELGKFASAWNGIPVVVNHPQEDNNFVSANQPSLAKEIVGRLFNVHMEGDKLKGEAWLNTNQLEHVSEDTFQRVEGHMVLEVSIGAFLEGTGQPGEFNQESYQAVATNIRPDHLALLPNAVGACSWDDGCGIRTNEKGKKLNQNANRYEMKDEKKPKDLVLMKGEHLIPLIEKGYLPKFITNEQGFREIMSSIQQKLDQLDNNVRVHFLEDVFDGNFVYRVVNNETQESMTFRRDYVVNADGSIEFKGDPTEVRKEVSFVNVNTSIQRTKFNNVSNKKGGKMKDEKCPCGVDELIANEATQFTEDNREWLTALSEDERKLLVPKEIKPTVNAETGDGKGTPEDGKGDADSAPAVNKNKDGSDDVPMDEKIREVFNSTTDPEDFIDKFLPEGLKGQMKTGLKMYNDTRAKLITEITANSAFKPEQLKDWADEDLKALHETVIPDADYSALGSNGIAANQEEHSEEVSAMIGLPVDSEGK